MLQLPKILFFLKNEGSGCIYRLKLTLQLLATTVCAPSWVQLTSAVSSFSNFLVLTLISYLKVFPELEMANLGVPGNL